MTMFLFEDVERSRLLSSGEGLKYPAVKVQLLSLKAGRERV